MDVREGTVALTCSGVLVSGWQAQVGSLNSEHGCMCVSQCVCVCVCVCVLAIVGVQPTGRRTSESAADLACPWGCWWPGGFY